MLAASHAEGFGAANMLLGASEVVGVCVASVGRLPN